MSLVNTKGGTQGFGGSTQGSLGATGSTKRSKKNTTDKRVTSAVRVVGLITLHLLSAVATHSHTTNLALVHLALTLQSSISWQCITSASLLTANAGCGCITAMGTSCCTHSGSGLVVAAGASRKLY